MASLRIMRFGGRVKRSKIKLDENSGRNLRSFIIRYRLEDDSLGLQSEEKDTEAAR
jgi:hypothetical protein